MRSLRNRRIILAALASGLAACGGGGSANLNSTPPPTPTPTPTPSGVAVTILPQPTAGEFASVGVSTNVGEWNTAGVPSTPSRDARMTSISSAAPDQPSIRYTSAGVYEVKLPGEAYDRLIHDPSIANPSPDDPFLRLQSQPARYFTIGSSKSGFRYSAMASWWRPDLDFAFTADFGAVAFGVPTSAGAVPVTGSANYQGFVSGITDAKTFDARSNSWILLPAGGTVALNFNFGTGTLGGQMALSVAGGMNPIDVGTYAFTQTVFSLGSTTYSGRFDTSLAGFNFFNGRFTGPNAQETIGNWAVPFKLDGNNHQAIGVWIAKTGN